MSTMRPSDSTGVLVVMSDLTDNQFYPSAERIWLCIRLNNAGNRACDRLIDDADFGKKKIIFSDEAHFDLGGYVNKQNCRIWDTENPHAYIKKPTHPKQVTVWCGFWSRCIIGPFFCENEKEEDIPVNGDRYRAMLNECLFTKVKDEDIGNIWFQHDSIFCTLFLKITLSAAELILFGYLGAAI